jgi:hypothetical protein
MIPSQETGLGFSSKVSLHEQPRIHIEPDTFSHSCFPNMKVYTVIYDSVPDAQVSLRDGAFLTSHTVLTRILV